MAQGLLPNKLLELFMQDRPDGWEQTAENWFWTLLFVAVVCAGLTFLYKAARKHSAPTVREKTWSHGDTWKLIAAGVGLVLLLNFVFWFTNLDFFTYAGSKGLATGTFFAWLFYLFLMAAGHLVSAWRREMF